MVVKSKPKVNTAYTQTKATLSPNRIAEEKPNDKRSIRAHPQLLLTADQKHLGGAVRLYVLAKNMTDYGWVEVKELKNTVFSIGVGKSSYYTWIKDAFSSGLFEYVFSGGKHIAKLVSYKHAYEILEVPFTDNQAALMPIDMLFCEGWKANVWAASNKVNFQDKSISQDKKSKLTGVPASTQRRLDKQAKIKRTRGISTSSYDATTSTLQAFQDNSNKKGIFISNGKIAWHVPSKSHVSTGKIVPVGSHRSMRKFGLSIVPKAVSVTPRLFCETNEEVKKAVEKHSDKRDGIYVLQSKGYLGGTTVWSFDVGK